MLETVRKAQRSLLDFVVLSNKNLGLEQRAEDLTQHFQAFLPEASQVLDVGGGWGFYSEPLKKLGHQYTVLDVVKPGVQKAPVVIYDPKDRFPFEDKSFDVSMFITVLHHISDPETVLREAIRVTQKQIIVVEDLFNHAFGRIWTQLRDQFYNVEFFGHPCNFKNRAEWKSVFASLGLEVQHEEEIKTKLLGLEILNGLFVLNINHE